MSPDRRTKRPVSDSGFARMVRRLRWPVMIAWLIAVVFLFPIANGLANATNNSNAANLPASAPSTRVIDLLLQQASQRGPGQPQSDTAFVVFARTSGLTAADMTAINSARTATGQLTNRTATGQLTKLARALSMPSAVQRSADGQAAYYWVNVTATASKQGGADTDAVRAIRAAVSGPAGRAGDGLQTEVTGPAAITADTGTPSTTDLELTAVVIVALVFFIVYRSILLWFFPLLGAVAGIVVAQASAHGLASAGLTVSSLSASILIVLVFGAASDYALLLVHRYREELGRHQLAEDAMAVALRRTLPTLVASAATVTVAMICLLVARSASLHGLGPVGAVGIVSALLAQTTFLPALLLVLGPAAFWPRIPRAGQAGVGESRLWSGIGTRVAAHPVRVMLASVILLGAACVGLVALRIDNSNISQVKGNPGSVVGAQLVDAHFPAGILDPIMILAPSDQAKAALAAAQATPGVAEVLPQSPVEGYASYLVITSGSPYGATGHAVIADLRQRLDQDAPGSMLGGDAAVQYDIIQASQRDALVLIPLILVVILLVIALLLRAVIAPLVLVLTSALSFAASFGLSDLLWRYGLGYSGIESQVPIYIFVFLVALGVDYNIFLTARIREESRQYGIRRGTLRGLSVTGGVITAAGIVLAATFAALIPQPTVYLTEVGSAVAIGVLLDTLLVRTVLVPAALLTIGERVWWPARPNQAAVVTDDDHDDRKAALEV
jgi:putative drug exporter of the RND superfamily